MAGNKKDPSKAIPHDPFEDMEFSDSPFPEDVQIPENIDGGIEVENSEVEASLSEPLAAAEAEILDETHLEGAGAAGGEEIKANAESGLDEDLTISETSSSDVEHDPDPIEPADAIDDPESGHELAHTDDLPQGQSSQLLTEAVADQDAATTETAAMTDQAVEAQATEDAEQHIIFTLAGAEYCAHISNVIEIGYPPRVTPLPNVPEWIFGLANLRGDIISVIDLCAFMGIGKIGYGPEVRMLVAKSLNEDFHVGLIVDAVSGIRYLQLGQIDESTVSTDEQCAAYMRGTYDLNGRPLIVLDMEQLLSSPEMQQFEPA